MQYYNKLNHNSDTSLYLFLIYGTYVLGQHQPEILINEILNNENELGKHGVQDFAMTLFETLNKHVFTRYY